MEEAYPHTPSFRLDGKRALVTGAGRGIGRASAVALAEAGAHVVLTARTSAEIEKLQGQIVAEGGSAQCLPLDMADIEAVGEAFHTLGAVDVLVNNAGTNRPAPLLDVTVKDYDEVTDLNVRGLFFASQHMVREMLAVGVKGSIINISSTMGVVGGPNRAVYCATKHAVEGMTKAMAMELAPNGIRVNAVAPTFIETPMARPFLANKEFAERVRNSIPLGRIGQVSEVMGAVVFLASDAASLITGTSLMVDGGWTAQ